MTSKKLLQTMQRRIPVKCFVLTRVFPVFTIACARVCASSMALIEFNMAGTKSDPAQMRGLPRGRSPSWSSYTPGRQMSCAVKLTCEAEPRPILTSSANRQSAQKRRHSGASCHLACSATHRQVSAIAR
jgi:hypothetical protein